MSRILLRNQSLVAMVLVMVWSGCASGPAPQDNYYRFDLPEPSNHMNPPPLQGTLLVARPWADALTAERSLLYRENGSATQVRRYQYHRWVDSPTTLLQQEIAGYMRAAGIAETVVTPELRAQTDYMLTCRIIKLERVMDSPPRSTVELELGITRMRDRHAVLHKTYRQSQPSGGKGVAASVDAYNQALSMILERFVTDSSQLTEQSDSEDSESPDEEAL